MRSGILACAAAICCAAVGMTAQSALKRKTVREPAYSSEQAERGRKVYEANCVTCHLPELDGSANATAEARGAPLVGTRFVQDFGESKVSALFNKMKRDMPSGKPGTLTDQEYLDAASFVLQRNSFPSGAAELTGDTAGDFWIPGAGGGEGLSNYTYVTAVGCLHQDPTRSWLLTNAQELKKTDVPAAGAAPTPAVTEGPGEYTFRLLDAFHYSPEPHNGHKVRVIGYMVRLGAEIRVNVQALQMVSATCGN
ncbi:MAG: c-type cytochrome [Vicinamibacterales bacterium]|nr:c-type cytochrome [Vicinamibacterales bacterium]